MKCEVTPPLAVVVPEVVVGVLPVNPDRQFWLFHMRYFFRSSASGVGHRKSHRPCAIRVVA